MRVYAMKKSSLGHIVVDTACEKTVASMSLITDFVMALGPDWPERIVDMERPSWSISNLALELDTFRTHVSVSCGSDIAFCDVVQDVSRILTWKMCHVFSHECCVTYSHMGAVSCILTWVLCPVFSHECCVMYSHMGAVSRILTSFLCHATYVNHNNWEPFYLPVV